MATITVNYTAYEWWMATWNKNRVVCSLVVDHEGQPTLGEIYENCDQSVYLTFKDQPSCEPLVDRRRCDGYYLVLVNTTESQREVTVLLPPPEIWLSLQGCDAVSRAGTNICEKQPILVLKGQEPLPNEHITRVEGTMDGKPFSCDAVCKLKLAPTDSDGVTLQFWAWSSYGDSSEVFTAQVRVARAKVNNPDQTSLYVDVLSSQWKGVRLASCADTWNTFPPVGGPPAWLGTPQDASDLSSDIPYSYLSANLILQGAVDASACPDGGLIPGGGANECGQEAARGAADAWQNQFDMLIMRAANNTGVPAQLLKNLFARESQFWPGVFRAVSDAGLGQLTENGADSTLFMEPVILCAVLSSGALGADLLGRLPALKAQGTTAAARGARVERGRHLQRLRPGHRSEQGRFQHWRLRPYAAGRLRADGAGGLQYGRATTGESGLL